MMNDLIFKIFISVLFSLFLLISCSENPSTTSKKAPTLPPATSLKMDFSSFDKEQGDDREQSTDNFSKAVGVAEKINTVVELNMMTPKLLLSAANDTDVQLRNNQWEWNYSKSIGEDSFTVRLTASHEDENTVKWDFYVTSSELGLHDQLLFSGISNTNGREGTWTYYRFKNATSQEKISQIDWNINEESEMELKLEITSDRNDNEDDYIKYSTDGNVKTAIYYDDSADENIEMQISADSRVGYFISPDYNEGNQSCWNQHFQDIACGEL